MTKPPVPQSDQEATLSTDLQTVFGESVRAARIKAGMKQSDLSERSGIAREEISRIENGLINLTLRQMSRLASVLGADVVKMLKTSQKQPKA